MVTIESPASLKRLNTPVAAVTIPTNPKSFGSSSRATTIKEPTRRKKFTPWAPSFKMPDRRVRSFRSVSDKLSFLYNPQGRLDWLFEAGMIGRGILRNRLLIYPELPACSNTVARQPFFMLEILQDLQPFLGRGNDSCSCLRDALVHFRNPFEPDLTPPGVNAPRTEHSAPAVTGLTCGAFQNYSYTF